MTKNNNPKIPDELLDQLLAGRDPRTALDPDGLIDELKKALALRIDAQLSSPRDRYSHIDPAVIHEYCQRFPGFDEKIVALYARGMSLWDIQRHVRKRHDIDISLNLISAVTDYALDEVTAWQVRPLESSYAIVFFDALHVKIRDGESVKSKAICLATGVPASGDRQVLGLWIEQCENGAEFWLQVMNDIKARGTQDILIAVVDDSKGCPEAITTAFPDTEVQTRILHLIRYSIQLAPWERRRSIASALSHIYCANSAAGAAIALEFFSLDTWGRRYPAITQIWRDNWEAVIPFFAFPAEVRKIIYTTNVIESLETSVRKAVRGKGHFPSDHAATKLTWLALRNIAESWKNAPSSWRAAKAELAIRFEERFMPSE